MGPGGQPMIRIKRGFFIVGAPGGAPEGPPLRRNCGLELLGARLVPPMLFAGNSLRPGPPLAGPVSIRFERFTVLEASDSAGGWVTMMKKGIIAIRPRRDAKPGTTWQSHAPTAQERPVFGFPRILIPARGVQCSPTLFNSFFGFVSKVRD
jgi:hypothetical protein